MRQFTRRTVLASAGATAATALAPIFACCSANGQTNYAPVQAITLKEFYANANTTALLPQERMDIVDQAIKLLKGFYTHLPLKRALYGVNPVERLQLLQQRLPQLKGDPAFHAEMRDIFASLRDLHTVYRLPEPYSTAHAWLPIARTTRHIT